MSTKTRIVSVIFGISLLPHPSSLIPARASDFSSSARGTTTAQFLQLGVGARGESMGEAYSAVADGADALYWNPAALTRVQGHDATLMHAPYIESSYYDSVQYAQKLGPGVVGAGLQYFSAGGITETDASGVNVGSFNPYDLAVTVGYGCALPSGKLEGYSVGGSLKFIQSRIATYAQTEAVDLGVLTPGYLDGKLRGAFTVTNLGGTMKFDNANENLPLTLRLGGSYKLTDGLTGSADVIAPRSNAPALALGTEYAREVSHGVSAALRGGYNTRTVNDVTGFTGFSFGVGLGYDKLAFDYAVVPFGDLGLTHRMSLSLHF